ncbi:ABC-type transport system involved in gliding motility [Bdellovibrio bacteriovorus W]|nr:ABC-type transport system involved in gliding motility [Bdellovibrio bacteriovorus W]
MTKIGKINFLISGISLVCMAIARYLIGEWVPFTWLCLAFAVITFIFGCFKERSFLKEFFSMKTTKEGMSMGTLIVLLIAILVIVNYLGVKYYKTWDFSSAQVNTLSPQSIQLIKGLDSDLKVYFFYKKGVEGNEENRRLFRELIKKYQDETTKIQLDFVEVNERPDLAQDFGVDKGSGVVFLDFKGRRSRIEKIDEQEFTSALVKVTRESVKTIYFTIGHGEPSLNETREGLGLGSLKSLLENNRYSVKDWAITQNPHIPQDADVIFVVGPTQGFQKFEIELLEKYLSAGGSLVLALESQSTVGLEALAEKVGLGFQNNFVFNVVETALGRAINQGPTVGAVFSESNKITKNFSRGEVTIFRFPQGISRKSAAPEGVIVDDIVRTTPSAVASNTRTATGGEGAEGSFTLVSEVTGVWPQSKGDKNFSLIMAGDMDFLSNQMLYQNMNRDLVLNFTAALAKEENLISIIPKDPQATELFLTETKFNLFLFGFIIPLPLILLGTATGIWLRRRNA